MTNTYYYKYPYTVDNKNAGLEVRSGSEVQDIEKTQLKKALLDKIAPIEIWTALGTNAQVNYSTHGLFRYFGKFPSTIATHLINQYTSFGGTVMDPMAGSGTTAVECLLSNRQCHSYDVNPLSILLAKVKTTYIDPQILNQALETIKTAYHPLSLSDYDRSPVGLRNPEHWFLQSTQESIRGLLYLIEKIEIRDVKDFFLICLCSIIRNVSRATSQQGRLFLDELSAKEDCLDTFVKKAEKGIERIAALPRDNSNIDIQPHNIEDEFGPLVNDLIILHPPYFNSYKYSSVNSLELSWLGYDHADIRKKEVRESFKVGKAEKVKEYVMDMKKALVNISKTLKNGGVIGMMIGDTVIKGEYIPVTNMLLEDFLRDAPTITIDKVILRVPKYTEASWSASQRRTSDKVGISLNDFVIILRNK